MQQFGRKTEAVPKRSFGLGNGVDESNEMHSPPVIRNSMRDMNHMQMKTLE